MLDDYKEKQPIVYRMMKNAVLNDKISHAYLIDTKNCSFGNQMVFSFVKYLLCPNQKTAKSDCGNCTQCQKIDDLNYIELKIIDPDGLWIKKEQVDELREEFSKKTLSGKFKIYIIHQVEKLNIAAANSLLKFLEEPENEIIALLTTNNIFQVLETIRSRCQLLSLIKEKDEIIPPDTVSRLKNYIKIDDCNESENFQKTETLIKSSLEFIDSLEKKGKEMILYTNKLWHSKIKEKEELLFAFDVMILFYNDALNQKCDRKIQIFFEYQSLLNDINSINNMPQLVNKIKILMDLKKKIKINMNTGLLLDKLILQMTGGD